MQKESVKKRFTDFIIDLQRHICGALEAADGGAKFKEDTWQKEGFGTGKTHVISNGKVFEKGGVNISIVESELSDVMKEHLKTQCSSFFVAGISLVIHPENPFVPTVHANYRYFELYDDAGNLADCWFGGGADLTPYYLFSEDAIHFHRTHQIYCDTYSPGLYEDYKARCDEYFYNSHRGESRGIGGIFFDYVRPGSPELFLDMVMQLGFGFTEAYIPIVEKRKNVTYTPKNRYWQEIRRGRYVEFNLIHDRGTLFGLKSNGRIESILMSLPPRVRWDYDYHPESGSEEERLIRHLKPVHWLNL